MRPHAGVSRSPRDPRPPAAGCAARRLDLPWWEKLAGASFRNGKFALKQLSGGKMDDITVMVALVDAVAPPPPPPPPPPAAPAPEDEAVVQPQAQAPQQVEAAQAAAPAAAAAEANGSGVGGGAAAAAAAEGSGAAAGPASG